MHIRKIEEIELNGMILQHIQTFPEIVYRGCCLCFINFDGDIEGVGTRIFDLNADEFETLKKLIGMIEFYDGDEADYTEMARVSMENIKSTAERLLFDFEISERFYSKDLDKIRKYLSEIDLINEKLSKLKWK
jgi:hypothetical protein